MLKLFTGLACANMIVLIGTFLIGPFAVSQGNTPTDLYAYHITMGVASCLLATVTHLAVFTYFMATSKWLEAASDKAGLDRTQYVAPAYTQKRGAIKLAMIGIGVMLLAVFAGAGADPTVNPLWPSGVHMTTAIIALSVNLGCMLGEAKLIKQQGKLMDQALAVFNPPPEAPPRVPTGAVATPVRP